MKQIIITIEQMKKRISVDLKIQESKDQTPGEVAKAHEIYQAIAILLQGFASFHKEVSSAFGQDDCETLKQMERDGLNDNLNEEQT